MFVQVSLAVLASCLFITGTEALTFACAACYGRGSSTAAVDAAYKLTGEVAATPAVTNYDPKCTIDVATTVTNTVGNCDDATHKCVTYVQEIAAYDLVVARGCVPNANVPKACADGPGYTCCTTGDCNKVAPAALTNLKTTPAPTTAAPTTAKNSGATHALNNLFYVVISAVFFKFF